MLTNLAQLIQFVTFFTYRKFQPEPLHSIVFGTAGAPVTSARSDGREVRIKTR